MAVYLFPGQGSQAKGMGGDLFERFPDLTASADRVLGYSIAELCRRDPERNLTKTQYTQPALYTVNALIYFKTIADNGAKPDFVAGHSLGEYNALLAAEAFDFETGLRLVQKRGELMSQARRGTMAAIIGLAAETIQDTLQRHGLEQIHIANYNSATQIVVSGSEADIERAETVFENQDGARFVLLNVSGAFHSPLMQAAGEEFARYLDRFSFQPPRIPVIANTTARPYPSDGVRRLLAEQITRPVDWNASMRYLLRQGETDFEEIGPGQVLTKLINKIRTEAPPRPEPAPPLSESLPRAADTAFAIGPEDLGSATFKADYNLRYAYLSGSMYKGIASKEIVVRMGKAGFMGFLGTGGMSVTEIEESLRYIQRELSAGQSYGMNLLANLALPKTEEEAVDLFLKYGVRYVEASAYIQLSPALVRYRLTGLAQNPDGSIRRKHRIFAKISRPEVALAFLQPAPERIVQKLLAAGQVTPEQAALAQRVPVADEICVEADSGGHTDQGVAYALMPAFLRLRDDILRERRYAQEIRIGAAGGIGTPQAALAALTMGADFILTGSINQCTVQAGTSDAVKDMLQAINVQDTDYAPAGDMFELGAKVQVLKKGVFFPARANKLYDLYRHYNSLDDIDAKTRAQIQDKYFKRSFDDVWAETKAYYARTSPGEIDKAERNPKHKMALIFRWYFIHTSRLALRGDIQNKVDFQVHCGPALGAFNQWVKGTPLEDWRNRHVDLIAKRLLEETAALMNRMFQRYAATARVAVRN